MKRLLFLLLIIFFVACSSEKNNIKKSNFIVNGIIKNSPKNTYVKLFYKNNKKIKIIDSTLIIDSTFTLNGKTNNVGFYGISFTGNKYNIYILPDSAKKINIYANFNKLQNYKVENSHQSKLIQILENKLYHTNKKIKAAIDSNKKIYPIIKKQRNFSTNFVSKHDSSIAVIIAFSEKFITGKPVLPIDSFYETFKNTEKKLSDKYSNSENFKEFATFIKNYEIKLNRNKKIHKNNKKPSELVNFSKKTISNKDFSLKKLKGSWILLNFWATWSNKSYQNNKFIEKTAKKHKKISIVQISIDPNERILKDTLVNYSFNHTLINDTEIWDSEIIKSYAIESVPTYILINPKGKIILHTTSIKKTAEKLDAI